MSKIQLCKIVELGRFLGNIPGPLLKTVLPLIKAVLKLLFGNNLAPVGLTAAALAADAGIHKQILGMGMKRLKFSKTAYFICFTSCFHWYT